MNIELQNKSVDERRTLIETWVVKELTSLLGVDSGQIHSNVTFDNFGLDSTSAVTLVGSLEDWLEHPLTPNLVYQHPTVRMLSQHLASTLELT